MNNIDWIAEIVELHGTKVGIGAIPVLTLTTASPLLYFAAVCCQRRHTTILSSFPALNYGSKECWLIFWCKGYQV